MNKINQILMFLLFPILGCSGLSPRENFKMQMNNLIGKRIDDIPDYKFGNKKYLIKTLNLSGDTYENIYTEEGPFGKCSYALDIDSKTKKVIGWRSHGDEKGCQVIP